MHLVDVSEFSGRDPAHDFDVIFEELGSFSPSLTEKPLLVAATKVDVCQDASRIEAVRNKAREKGLPFFRDF